MDSQQSSLRSKLWRSKAL